MLTMVQALPIRQFLLTNLIRYPGSDALHFRIPLQTLSAALNKMGDFPFKDPEEVHFDGPALFIRGIRSHYVADEILPLVGRFFPRFELCDIDCGHWVISEQPVLFKQGMILNFVYFSDAKQFKAVVEFLQRQEQ